VHQVGDQPRLYYIVIFILTLIQCNLFCLFQYNFCGYYNGTVVALPAMKVHEGLEVQLHSLLAPALDRRDLEALRPVRLIPE
jgi:hypothetical protein